MRFLNFFIAELVAPLAAAADELPINEAALARFDLTGGEHYVLVLVGSLNPMEQASGEIVHLRDLGAGPRLLRGQEGSVAREWPAGAYVYCAVTAGVLNSLTPTPSPGGAYLSRESFVEQIYAGALGGVPNALAFGHADVGALLMIRGGGSQSFAAMPWLGAGTVSPQQGDGPLTAGGDGAGAGVSKVSSSDGRLLLHTGGTAYGSAYCQLASEGSASTIALSQVDIATLRCIFQLAVLSTVVQAYSFDIALTLPGLSAIRISYRHDVNAGRFVVRYIDSVGEEQSFNTTTAATTSTSTVLVKLEGGSVSVVFGLSPGTTWLTIPVSDIGQSASNGGILVQIGKSAGTASRTAQVHDMYGEARLII